MGGLRTDAGDGDGRFGSVEIDRRTGHGEGCDRSRKRIDRLHECSVNTSRGNGNTGREDTIL